MNDETTNTQQGDAAQSTGDATGTNGGEQPRTYTQEDLERILSERLARERQKAEQMASRAKAEAERKAAEEQGKFQELYQKAQSELERVTQAHRAAEMAILRRDVAARLNVPPALADRLRGETVEELEVDAKSLLSALPTKQAPPANAGAGANQAGATTPSMNDFIRAAAGKTAF